MDGLGAWGGRSIVSLRLELAGIEVCVGLVQEGHVVVVGGHGASVRRGDDGVGCWSCGCGENVETALDMGSRCILMVAVLVI